MMFNLTRQKILAMCLLLVVVMGAAGLLVYLRFFRQAGTMQAPPLDQQQEKGPLLIGMVHNGYPVGDYNGMPPAGRDSSTSAKLWYQPNNAPSALLGIHGVMTYTAKKRTIVNGTIYFQYIISDQEADKGKEYVLDVKSFYDRNEEEKLEELRLRPVLVKGYYVSSFVDPNFPNEVQDIIKVTEIIPDQKK